MAARVYTQRFILHSGPGTSVQYTVPAGYRAIIRSLDGYVADAASSGLALFVGSVVIARLVPGAGGSAHLELRLPAYAGEIIYASTWGTDTHVAVAGYIFEDLTGPVGRQAPGLRTELLPAGLRSDET